MISLVSLLVSKFYGSLKNEEHSSTGCNKSRNLTLAGVSVASIGVSRFKVCGRRHGVGPVGITWENLLVLGVAGISELLV